MGSLDLVEKNTRTTGLSRDLPPCSTTTLAYMMTSAYDLRLTAERHPQVHFHPLREHAGLSLSTQ